MSFDALTLLAGQQKGHPVCKITETLHVDGGDITGALPILSSLPSSLSFAAATAKTVWYSVNRLP